MWSGYGQDVRDGQRTTGVRGTVRGRQAFEVRSEDDRRSRYGQRTHATERCVVRGVHMRWQREGRLREHRALSPSVYIDARPR